MANINFPNDPSVNDVFTVNGKSYKWDGVKWVAKTTVDKSDVGLGNVQNFSLADEAEAKAGSVNNKYMTPLRTAQAIAELAPDPDFTDIDSHIADTTIHFTKASLEKGDVGLGNVDNTADANKFVAGVIETRNSDSLQFWQGTEAQYDAIGTKNANTIYLITE